MIRVRCTTNLDAFKDQVWPQIFVCRPVIGDVVLSHSGMRLHIVEVRHDMQPIDYQGNLEPVLIIELHKRGSI